MLMLVDALFSRPALSVSPFTTSASHLWSFAMPDRLTMPTTATKKKRKKIYAGVGMNDTDILVPA